MLRNNLFDIEITNQSYSALAQKTVLTYADRYAP